MSFDHCCIPRSVQQWVLYNQYSINVLDWMKLQECVVQGACCVLVIATTITIVGSNTAVTFTGTELLTFLSRPTAKQCDARTLTLPTRRLGWEGGNHLCEAQQPKRKNPLSPNPSSLHLPGPYSLRSGLVFTSGITALEFSGSLLRSSLSVGRSLRDITKWGWEEWTTTYFMYLL